MCFDPKVNKFPYPVDTSKHYLEVKKNMGIVFDINYPYIDNSKEFRRKVGLMNLFIKTIVYLVVRIRLNLRIKGKENLKKYKDVINNGCITVCNHVHMWDYLAIKSVFKKQNTKFLAWAPNINGEFGKVMRIVGGVPIPEDNLAATKKCIKEVEEFINNKGMLHIYPEGSMWEFYQPIRPFKVGAAYYSIKCNKPILPLAFSYRKNGFIRRLFKSPASFTLTIGEPIYPNNELTFKDNEIDLTNRIHDEVCKLAGINPLDNLYGKVYNNDKRIDYYTTEYGINYKGSF